MNEKERIASALFYSKNPTADKAIANVTKQERQAKSHKQQVIDTMLSVARLAGYKAVAKIDIQEAEND